MTITVAGEKKEVKDGLTLPELIVNECRVSLFYGRRLLKSGSQRRHYGSYR